LKLSASAVNCGDFKDLDGFLTDSYLNLKHLDFEDSLCFNFKIRERRLHLNFSLFVDRFSYKVIVKKKLGAVVEACDFRALYDG
jgi:hypothetical protein